MSQRKRHLTGYCGWHTWNNSGKTCDQKAVELAADGSIQIAQAKTQILTQGCVCGQGESSFVDDVIDLNAFCGRCQFKNANFLCDDRVEYLLKNYPQHNPTKVDAWKNLMRDGDCIDRNWVQYAAPQGNEGLTRGGIVGIVIAVLALFGAGVIGFFIMRDWKKGVKKDNEGVDKQQIQEATTATSNQKPNNGLHAIEEGDDEDNGEEESESGSFNKKVGGMGDDETEIVANTKSKMNLPIDKEEGWTEVSEEE